MKYIILTGLGVIFLSCTTMRNYKKDWVLAKFKKVIVGNFNNAAQVSEEIKNSKQVHPLAKHVNRIADAKIINLPKTKAVENFWVLEESYYEYPNKPIDIKPYLFNFYAKGKDSVGLLVFQLPNNYKKEEIRNDNPNLVFDYTNLHPSPTFKGATYYYDNEKKVFTTTSINDLGNGMTFTLTETLSLQQLMVMELVEKNGKRLTPYDSPIVYDRE
jgi:hypothetical protein